MHQCSCWFLHVCDFCHTWSPVENNPSGCWTAFHHKTAGCPAKWRFMPKVLAKVLSLSGEEGKEALGKGEAGSEAFTWERVREKGAAMPPRSRRMFSQSREGNYKTCSNACSKRFCKAARSFGSTGPKPYQEARIEITSSWASCLEGAPVKPAARRSIWYSMRSVRSDSGDSNPAAISAWIASRRASRSLRS